MQEAAQQAPTLESYRPLARCGHSSERQRHHRQAQAASPSLSPASSGSPPGLETLAGFPFGPALECFAHRTELWPCTRYQHSIVAQCAIASEPRLDVDRPCPHAASTAPFPRNAAHRGLFSALRLVEVPTAVSPATGATSRFSASHGPLGSPG